jgi:outer membrane protein assembly factor BamD
MQVVKFFLCALALSLSFAACGDKKPRIALEQPKGPGRDLELLHDGIKAIIIGRYEQGRMLLNTMINTYSDSPLIKISKLAIADSFYLEGGSKALEQADVEYIDWLQFFPDDPLSDDVMIKRAEIYLRQVQTADRATTQARIAERILKEVLRRFPTSDNRAVVEERLNEVQEILALHELKVARFYFDHREAPIAAQMRTEEILNNYPQFTRFDEALFVHAMAMKNQEDTETASRDLSRIVTSYPHSEFRERAEATLRKWGRPVPEPDPARLAEAPPESKSLPERIAGFLIGPRIDTSNKGVVIDRDQKPEQVVARARELAGVKATGSGSDTSTNSPNARPRRAVQAGQDVEVKPGTPSDQKQQQQSTSSKDKKGKEKKKDDDKKNQENP